ncbi:hypothetical protein H2O64_14390 [Kordia sp. YSTF-M3]|uniref:Uncharacterized protein n=1 Tax=Kordia aestuariivivens TaxID=2759037 RepID=A0ABR7QBK1_9FLAO|nr:hypothetical protein [Kordia aestuariivivens]MBC8755863.1 hypothetical protein [Kordia aestuariivivens]
MMSQRKNQFKIKEILRGIVLYLCITMSLYHVSFNFLSNEQIEHKKTYVPIIKERNENQQSLFNKFEKNEITKSDFLRLYKEQTKLSKTKINNYNYVKRDLALAHSFNGRNSFQYWLFVFGLSFSFFALSIRYTLRIIYDHKNKYLKKSLVLEASAWIAVSLFWVIHSIFITNADLPTPIYASVMFCICLVLGFSIFFSIKYLINRKAHTLKSYKASIVNLIELIGEIRVDHYFKMAAKAMTKENKEIISKDSEVMDKKIFSTLEKVADGE